RIFRLLIVAFAVIVAFPYIPGSESPAFKGVSLFLGVLFSLGSQSTVSNILAGFTLTYRRLYKVGDRVRIDDIVGDVTMIRVPVTHLKTVKNEEVIIPNSTILNSNVTNYSSLSMETGLILHTTVTIGYDAPWRQVHALLLMAAERTPGLLKDPPPFVFQKSLDDFYVSYELNVYTDMPHAMGRLYSDLHQNIQDCFNEYGVQIMSPNYEADRPEAPIVPKERWYEAPAQPPGSGGQV
ncbi:MAG: MscS Mechanosensitive ion channel, partial [Geobacteraceae bacterium]|nr:MscS Mechanosensitive ion channel [Geobacteraceae bacterium]